MSGNRGRLFSTPTHVNDVDGHVRDTNPTNNVILPFQSFTESNRLFHHVSINIIWIKRDSKSQGQIQIGSTPTRAKVKDVDDRDVLYSYKQINNAVHWSRRIKRGETQELHSHVHNEVPDEVGETFFKSTMDEFT